jgi:hypothetical protein
VPPVWKYEKQIIRSKLPRFIWNVYLYLLYVQENLEKPNRRQREWERWILFEPSSVCRDNKTKEKKNPPHHHVKLIDVKLALEVVVEDLIVAQSFEVFGFELLAVSGETAEVLALVLVEVMLGEKFLLAEGADLLVASEKAEKDCRHNREDDDH